MFAAHSCDLAICCCIGPIGERPNKLTKGLTGIGYGPGERGGKYTDRPSRLLPCVIRLQHQHIIGTQSAPCRKKPKSLRASRETLLALREHPLLKKRNKSGWSRHELFNQYYDTAERDLAHARVALRLRRDGEQFIQTLKSRGQSVAGLSERNEWDWYGQGQAGHQEAWR